MPGSKVVDLKIMTHTDMGAYVPSAILSFKKKFIYLAASGLSCGM